MGVSKIDPAEIIVEEATEADLERRRLSDISFALLYATDGDPDAAVKLLDDFVDLVVEGGLLQIWRYRQLLAMVKEGL